MVGRGFLRYWVLRLLSEEPRTGYGLAKELERRLGWRPSSGSLYPLLASLAEQGLIERGAGKRALLRLTPKGAEELKRLEKGKDEWKAIVNLLGSASQNLPGFSRFLRLFARALASGNAEKLEEILARVNAELEGLAGGEGDGSSER